MRNSNYPTLAQLVDLHRRCGELQVENEKLKEENRELKVENEQLSIEVLDFYDAQRKPKVFTVTKDGLVI